VSPHTFHIGLVTVIGTELSAVQRALHIDNWQDRHHVDGDILWSGNFASRPTGATFQALVHCIGEPGQQAAAAAATRIIERFHPGMMLLIGIAAGRRNKVKIGDVAIPRSVVDTTLKVAEVTGLQGRPKIPPIHHVVQQMLAGFRLDRDRWHRGFKILFPRQVHPPAGMDEEYAQYVADVPTLHDVAIASDNILLRDPQPLEIAAQSLHQQIRIGEMEAGGFITACESRAPKVPWFVIRGVSDFGDAFKNDAFHELASCAAASYLTEFLVNGLDPELIGIKGDLSSTTRGQSQPLAARPSPVKPQDATPPVSIGRLPLCGHVFLDREPEMMSLDTVWSTRSFNTVAIVAPSGVGKTTLVRRWLRKLADNGYVGAENVFAWSFYGAGNDMNPDPTSREFFLAASKWFGFQLDTGESEGAHYSRALTLARCVRAYRTILVLDGLEPVLNGPKSPRRIGSPRDLDLRVLLRELGSLNPGILVLTTTVPIPDVEEDERKVLRMTLSPLSAQHRRELIRQIGGRDSETAIEATVEHLGDNTREMTLFGPTYFSAVVSAEKQRSDAGEAIVNAIRSIEANEDVPLEARLKSAQEVVFAEGWKLLRRAVPPWAVDEAGDIVADVLEGFCSRMSDPDFRKRFLATKSPLGYLYASVRYGSISEWRRKVRWVGSTVPLDTLENVPAEPQDFDALESERRLKELRKAMASLPTTDKELIDRLYFGNTPIRTLAEEYKISLPAMYGRRSRALRRLQAAVLRVGASLAGPELP